MESTECAMTVRTFKTSDGQVKIYIKPIQRSLSVIPIREELLSSISLKEKCIYCEKEFLLKDLRLHIDLFSVFQTLRVMHVQLNLHWNFHLLLIAAQVLMTSMTK